VLVQLLSGALLSILTLAGLAWLPRYYQLAKTFFSRDFLFEHFQDSPSSGSLVLRKATLFFLLLLFWLVNIAIFCLCGFVAIMASFVALLFHPSFWIPSKRKGLRRSFVQASHFYSRYFWAHYHVNWNPRSLYFVTDEPSSSSIFTGEPSFIVTAIFWFAFFVCFFALPIQDSVSDFLYSQALYDIAPAYPYDIFVGLCKLCHWRYWTGAHSLYCDPKLIGHGKCFRLCNSVSEKTSKPRNSRLLQDRGW